MEFDEYIPLDSYRVDEPLPDDDQIPALPPPINTDMGINEHRTAVGNSGANAGTDRAVSQTRNGKDLDKVKGKKKRKPMKKVDAELLLSNKGLSQLRHKGPKLRFQGKGNEAKDLRKLMNFYQIWAHALYPRVQFRDFVRKAEKTCREKRCRVHLAQWQNEVRHGTTDATLAEHGLSGMTLEDEENVARSGSRPVSIDRDEAIQHSKEPQLSPQPPARLHHSTSSSPPRQDHNAVASTSSSRLTTATAPTSTSTDGPAPLSPLERIQFNRAKALAKLAERRRQPEEEEKAKASQQATTVSQQTTIANGGSAAASSSRVMGPFEFDEEPMDEMDPAEEYFDEF